MVDSDIMESLAHQTRGAAIMYFLILGIYLFRFRKDSRMMQMLFVSTVCICLGFLKDSAFLFERWQQYPFADEVTGIIDLSVMLAASNFFMEAVKPGSTKNKLVWTGAISEFLFVPVFLIFPGKWTGAAAFIFGFCILALTVANIIIYALRHKTYLADNYSYNENIDVRWVVVSGVTYILVFLIYCISFFNATWMSEIFFCLFSIIIWGYMIASAKGHIVLQEEESDTPETAEGDRETEYDAAEADYAKYLMETIEPRLTTCMTEEKLYLNPSLSLKTVATKIGSNTKYLSTYLNRCAGTSFYDYINSFRVKEACSIIQGMNESSRINMAEISEKSGFNSISSFNRHFRHIMGITPTEYYKNCNRHSV